jgi:hypothetical protein
VLAFAAAPASLARGAGAVPAPAIQTSVTGEIGKLGPGRIAIGRTACSIPASLATKVGRFVVTDPVEITCRNGRLEAIKYVPEVAVHQSLAPATAAPAPPPRSGAPSTAAPGTRAAAYTAGVDFATPPAGTVTTTTGTIAEISADGIAVGELGCSLRPSFYAILGPLAAVGDDVTVICVAGSLTHIATVSTVRR